MNDFIKGFTKQANIFTKSVNKVTSLASKAVKTPNSQKVISGLEFQAKQKALLAARASARTPAANKFIERAGAAAKESVTGLSAHAKNKASNMNGKTLYSRAGVGVDSIN